MTREELEELYYIPKEIEQLEEKVKKKEKQSEMVSDVVQNGYKRHLVICGVDLVRKYKIDRLRAKQKKFKKMLRQKQIEIEEYIQQIPFSEIRQIFRYRYLEGKNWVQVAHQMNKFYENGTYTESSTRQKHDRYLEKN